MNKKKKQIIEAAQTLFIKKGFSATSIQDILETAQISKGTFYHYFSSKTACLMAILVFIQDEVHYDRMQLAIGKSKTDKNVLIQQIAARFHIDKKHNIMALFSSLSNSDSSHQDLKDFMTNQFLQEISWMATRIMDLFGDTVKERAYDYAASCFGTIHVTAKMVRDLEKTAITIEDTIEFALKHIQQLVDTENNQPAFLKRDYFISYQHEEKTNKEEAKIALQQTLESIQPDIKEMKNEKLAYYHEFLIQQLKEEPLNMYLIESVVSSYEQGLKDTKLEDQGKYIWNLFQQVKA